MAKILLFTPSFKFKNIHFYKDVFIIPEIFKNEYNAHIYILTQKNEEKYLERGATLVFSDNVVDNIFNYLKIKADVVFMFHLTKKTLFYLLIFKILRKKTKIIIKLDGEYIMDTEKSFLFLIGIKIFFKLSDVITIESLRGIDYLKNNYVNIGYKFFYLPNGYYSVQYPKYSFTPETKEKLIITVGRLGTYQKNTELLLDILREILGRNMDYHACLIGSIEANFESYIESYFQTNPHLKSRISFVGPIGDRVQLFEYYKRARFFFLSSRFDITPNVYTEAGYFGNIIVTTDVGGGLDITNNGKTGYVFGENQPMQAVDYTQSVIDAGNMNTIGRDSTNYIQREFNYLPHIESIYRYLYNS